jgi:RNA polymerase sigma-70 factor, ECF subfamily
MDQPNPKRDLDKDAANTRQRSNGRQIIEATVRDVFDQGDYDRAATLVIESFGPEILGFLAARMRSESDAYEVFSEFCEDLWRGLPGFEWRCSVRAWAYTLALRASSRFARAPHRRPGHNVPLSQATAVQRLAARTRSRTFPNMPPEAPDRLRALRERLPEEDQALLILRVDKGLSWRELALVLSPADSHHVASNEDLDREAARLRKRFQLIKQKLRDWAAAEGLFTGGSDD